MTKTMRSLFGILMLAAVTAGLGIPAAEAGGRWKHRRAGYQVQRAVVVEYRGGGGYRGARGYDRGCESHAAHRFFDGRAYCAGKTADGCWRSEQRCEDDWGRKLVNDPAWVASFARGCDGGEPMGWRGDRGRW